MQFFVKGGDHDGWLVVGARDEKTDFMKKGEGILVIQSHADVPCPRVSPDGMTVRVVHKHFRLMDIREEAFLDVLPRAAFARRLMLMPNGKERNREVWKAFAEHGSTSRWSFLQKVELSKLPDEVLRDREIMLNLIRLGFKGTLDVQPPDLEVSAAYLERWGRLQVWPTDETWLEANVGSLTTEAFLGMSPEMRDRLALTFLFTNVPKKAFTPWGVSDSTAARLAGSVSPPLAAKVRAATEWISGVRGERPRLSHRSCKDKHLWGVHVVARVVHKMFGNHELGANEMRSQLRSFSVDALLQICEDAVDLVPRVRALKPYRTWNFLAEADENLKPQMDASHLAALLHSELRCRKIAKKDYPDGVINFLGSHLSDADAFQAQFAKITKKRDRDAFEADNNSESD